MSGAAPAGTVSSTGMLPARVILPLLIALAFSTILEGYRWSPEAIAGSALAAAGLFFALRARAVG